MNSYVESTAGMELITAGAPGDSLEEQKTGRHQAKASAGQSVFVSYAQRDERYREKLDISLAQLRRNRLISVWYDRKILPGQEWDREIDKNLESADIVLLLVSPDFLASDYAYGREMLRALERHRSGSATVVPIILRPSDWQHSPLASLQALPSKGRPVSSWPNRDQAWLDVVQGLRQLISGQGSGTPPAASVPRSPSGSSQPLHRSAARAHPPGIELRYTNAKVVLIGESGTGKSCLARALMGQPFEPQPSTHGIQVWTFLSHEADRPGGGQSMREILLWDLAGLTDYQIVHPLFLDETALGIVVFDPSHPDNPFWGVGTWEKSLRQVAGADCPRLLVAGRVDRGYPAALEGEIEAFRRAHGFREFVATSAKTGEGIILLRDAIARAIPWESLAEINSRELWKWMREYLLERRASDDVLTRRSDLCKAFRVRQPQATFEDAEFDTVIRQAQARGLVWRLSIGDLLLLKPELLNVYASAIVMAARRHPRGLGSVSEQDVLQAQIDLQYVERRVDAATETLLLYAVVELFLQRQIAMREGQQLVFPSKFNRTRPDFPNLPPREVVYTFAGQVEYIYETLVVRLEDYAKPQGPRWGNPLLLILRNLATCRTK